MSPNRGAAIGVRVPASSANLGAGFDALAIALDRHLLVARGPDVVSERHPAAVAHREAGGDGRVSVRAEFPGGRGLGYSGAARVGGALLARLEAGKSTDQARDEALELAGRLEGHAENAAASALGGLVVTAGDRVVRSPIALDLAVVLWIPEEETSTRQSRRRLPESVAFADAVFNVGRAALLVAALATGDAAALRAATEDRLHQDRRLELAPHSRDALHAMLTAGALAVWLSGSGPTVAGFVEPERAVEVAAALPGAARREVAAIATTGAVVVEDPASS